MRENLSGIGRFTTYDFLNLARFVLIDKYNMAIGSHQINETR